jgi:hypothetical protein
MLTQDDDDVPGAYVEWSDANGAYVNNIFGRANESPLMNYGLVFNNGSVMSYARPMTAAEVMYITITRQDNDHIGLILF